MTMHVVIEANDGGIVLVSDLLNRLGPQAAGEVFGSIYHSKVAHSVKHNLIAAMEGRSSDPNAEPQRDLVKYLENYTNATHDDILRWAREYAKDGDEFSLLIINPFAEIDRIWKVLVGSNG